MNPETQALIATLAWMIENERLHRQFDCDDGETEPAWSPEMQDAIRQLEEFQSGKLMVILVDVTNRAVESWHKRREMEDEAA